MKAHLAEPKARPGVAAVRADGSEPCGVAAEVKGGRGVGVVVGRLGKRLV